MSTGVGVSACCLSGKVHDGTPVGQIETIGGLSTYVSAAPDASKAMTIIFLVDVLGWEFPNVRLLADQYAKAGFYTLIPDVHKGDSLSHSFLQTVEPNLATQQTLSFFNKAKNTAAVATTLGPWLFRHREAVSKPIIDDFVAAVRKIDGVKKVGAIGFCWGGRYAILQTHEGGVDAAYACHPSLVAIPGDFEKVQRPLSLAVGTKDSLLDEKSIGSIREAMDKVKAAHKVEFEIRPYEDQVHGFALRSDWSSDKDRKAMDDAEKQGIDWFKKYLA